LHFARAAGTIGTLTHRDFLPRSTAMKKHLPLVTFLAVLGLAASVTGADDKKSAKDNTPPEGFTALFNGKDLTNWQGLIDVKTRSKLSKDELEKKQKEANEKILPHWTVQDGVLVYDGKGNNLQTAKDYGDFELYVDWKIEKNGDSGIYLRGQPQVQIWDSDNSPGAKGEDKNSGSGGLWNNPLPDDVKDSKDIAVRLKAGQKIGKVPLKKADKPLGEWNTFHIIMKGDNVTVFLNGEKVVDDAPLANYWEKGKPLPAKGPIELQHHGDKLWFKNIYIKELPASQLRQQ
jgi:hypothetical protein